MITARGKALQIGMSSASTLSALNGIRPSVEKLLARLADFQRRMDNLEREGLQSGGRASVEARRQKLQVCEIRKIIS